MKAQCLLAQSHDPVGFAEPSESYIFVGYMSIIELGTLHLVTTLDPMSQDNPCILVEVLMIQNSRTMPDKFCAEQGWKVSGRGLLINNLLRRSSKTTACSAAEICQPWTPE
ncbi:hypothetical protein ACP70R_028673 [Stipagrostis hirtigluma subsp. patula]